MISGLESKSPRGHGPRRWSIRLRHFLVPGSLVNCGGSSLHEVPQRDDSKPRRRSGSNPSRSSRSDGGAPTSRTGSPAGKRSGSPRRLNEDRRPAEPKTEAERRRAAVRARGGGSARDPNAVEAPVRRDSDEPEVWIDEGPVRSARDQRRDKGESLRRPAQEVKRPAEVALSADAIREVARVVDPRRAEKLATKLESARYALDRERYSEAKRIARALLKETTRIAAVHEVIGLASYRLGQWRDATAALEMARHMSERVEHLPILADCYRAQKRWSDVDGVWKDLKEESPAPDIMAEGRIVMAGSLADRGDLHAAIELMTKAASVPRRIREYHLRQWYVLADLYDRAGDIQRARELFARLASHDSGFADVRDRLKSL